MSTNSSLKKEVLMDRIKATIYGNCIGDAIGLLTEFMTKKEAIDVSFSISFLLVHQQVDKRFFKTVLANHCHKYYKVQLTEI